MKSLIKKIGSVLIALFITLSVVGFAGATRVSTEELQKFLKQFPMGDPEVYNSSNMPYLKQYPKVVDALSQLLIDLKADSDDFDTSNKDSLATKLYSYRIKQNFLELNSRYKNMLIFMGYVSVLDDYKFVNNYRYKEDKSLYGPLHFCYMSRIIDSSGNENFNFYWIDKQECKEIVKKMMNGTFDINENLFWKDKFKNDDHDLLFLKYTQDAIIKYFGDIDSFFDDEEFSTKFFRTMFEIITDNGKSPGNDQKMISTVSNNKAEAVNDYKKFGHSIIKRTLEYRGQEEGKDYQIEYDETTGYIKSIKKLSSKDLKNGSVAVVSQFMNSILLVACVFLALIVIAVVVILVVVLTNKKR